jgi:hypothetical protein
LIATRGISSSRDTSRDTLAQKHTQKKSKVGLY